MPGRCRRCRISRSSRRACGDPRSRAPGCRLRALWSSRCACGDPRSCATGCRRCRTLRSSSRSCGARRSCAAACVQCSAGSGGLACAAGSRRAHTAVPPSVRSRVARIARQDRWLSLPEFSPSFRRPALAHSRGHPRHLLRLAAWPCAARFRGILAACPLTTLAHGEVRAALESSAVWLSLPDLAEFPPDPCSHGARFSAALGKTGQSGLVSLRQRSTPAASLARHRVLALSRRLRARRSR